MLSVDVLIALCLCLLCLLLRICFALIALVGRLCLLFRLGLVV